MIGALRGVVIAKKPGLVLIETNGVGYEVHVPVSQATVPPGLGDQTFLFVFTYVKEDAIQLYGFATEEEKFVFMKVLSVSGVGPRLALSILSTVTVEDFRQAVEAEDLSVITHIPGIGKKTAGRLILELKGKLPAGAASGRDSVFDDALSALVNLGYRRQDVQETLDRLSKEGIRDIERLVRESLLHLSKRDKKK